jgi:hypothetical protein
MIEVIKPVFRKWIVEPQPMRIFPSVIEGSGVFKQRLAVGGKKRKQREKAQ